MDIARFHSLGRHLRATLPTPLPVSIRLHPFPARERALGDCDKVDGRFRLRAEKGLETEQALGVLLHEYAHAMTWGLDSEDHGEWFQEARRVCFQAYLRWLRGG